jgi:uncharacterized protein YegL
LFEVPFITVLSPGIVSTPAIPPVPPTYTPTPEPTVTPTPRPQPIYLPVNLNQRCQVTEAHADIVLMLDVSTSMTRATSAGRSKMEAVLEASKAFAGAIDMTPNELNQYGQMSVAGFNATAWVEVPLTNDLNAVYAALDRLPSKMREFTRLDLAVTTMGEAVLGPNHKPENEPVVVLLTDGLPNQVPYAEDGTMETTVIRAADALRANGIESIYTIGVGVPDSPDPNQRINPELLIAIAGDEDRYFEASDAEEVSDILEDLKSTQSCGKLRWGDPIP